MVDLRHVHNGKGDRDNVQIGADMTLCWPQYTMFSAALFVDELSIAPISDAEKSRNWVAGQFGVRVFDLWGLWPRSTVRIEYTRLNPWVYEHRFPWSTFASAGVGVGSRGTPVQYPLGHWLGQNADGFYGEVVWYPLALVEAVVKIERTRHGTQALAAEQSYSGPDYRATPFLSGPVVSVWRTELRIVKFTKCHTILGMSVGYEHVDLPAVTNGEWSAKVDFSWNMW
jgi:hypothetical protein